MKKLIYSLMLLSLSMLLYSCVDVDNYDEPEETFMGAITDATTGDAFLTETGGIQIRLEELSWSSTPTPQNIPCKEDGTFNNNRLFKGHYRVTPTEGAFWPVTPIELDIKGTTSHNFELTPYLKIKNLTHALNGRSLTLKFNLDAPLTGLPKLLDIRPFVNITHYVGAGANINDYSEPNRIDINADWSDDIKNRNYEITIPDMKEGRTFYVRVGARVDDSYKKYNYSEIIEVKIP